MAIPIAPTPILEGREASDFLDRLMTEESDKKSLVPTPKLKTVKEKILAEAQRRKK
jgi:hypothetical protein